MDRPVALGIVGPRNEPLYVRVFDDAASSSSSSSSSSVAPASASDEAELRFHYYLHAALDVVDEKVQRHRRARSANANNGGGGGAALGGLDGYLGLLFAVEDYKIYAAVTNTRAKLVLVLSDAGAGERSAKTWLRDLRDLYAQAVCNPFNALATDTADGGAGTDRPPELRTARFDALVDAVVGRS